MVNQNLNSSQIISVTQLTNAIKQKLESSFSQLSVRAEVSNLRTQSSGHLYFTLKDQGSQISAVLFRRDAAKLTQPLKEGDQVVVHGELSLYVPRGNYQLLVREIEFSGVGALLQQLHALKLKLKGLGWFDKELKKPLPTLPKTIGVVTSPTGSVIQDILNVLSRRFSSFSLVLYPAKVQGEGAAEEIAKGIEVMNQYALADVLIVGRGGGSFEDLWPFNEEVVASSIHHSKIPIISAVGHETDVTMADFVADRRAPTPSAAAEMVISEKAQLNEMINNAQQRVAQTLLSTLRFSQQQLQSAQRDPFLKNPFGMIETFSLKLDDMKQALKSAMEQVLLRNKLQMQAIVKQKESLNPLNRIQLQKKAFTEQSVHLLRVMRDLIAKKRQALSQLAHHLEGLNPEHLLKKGYSIVFCEKSDSVILSKEAVSANDRVRVRLSDGQIVAKVETDE